MRPRDSLTLSVFLLLGVLLLVLLNKGETEIGATQEHQPIPLKPETGSQKYAQATHDLPLPSTRDKLPKDLPPRTFTRENSRFSDAEEAGVASLQNLTPIEVQQKFEEAIGRGLLLSLPGKQRHQIFRRFRDRLAAPLEPTSFLCWSAQTPLAVAEASHRAEMYASRLIESEISAQAFQSLGSGRWTSTASGTTGAYGTPIKLTWSIAPDWAINDEGQSSGLIARLAVIYALEGANTTDPPDQQPWFSLFTSAFDNMSEETGIIFEYEPNDNGVSMSTNNDGILGVRGDIRIFGGDIDGNFNTLAYNYSPGYGDMVIDTGDSFFNDKSDNSIRLRNTLGHEIGHGLGLGHVCPQNSTKLMEPTINTNFSGAQFDEVISLQRRYGDHLERSGGATNNDTSGNAGTLSLTPGSTTIIPGRLSIDDNSDSDYYRVIASANQSLTATVTPTSESYLESGDNGNCSGGGTSYDFSSYHDLTLEVRNSRNSLLMTSNSQGLGSPESITYTFPSSGTYYLRVSGDSTNFAQIYSLSATLQNPTTTLTLTSSDTIMSEGDGSDTASVTINASSPVATALTLTLLPSGNASASDFASDLTATIPAGEMVSNPVVIRASPDNVSESNETLTLTLPNYSGGPTLYALGNPQSQDITILNATTPVFSLASATIVAESFSAQNGVPDPEETLEVMFSIENIGSVTGTNVTGSLSGPSGLVPFTATNNHGTLTSGSSAGAPYVFGLTGDCGEELILDLLISCDEGVIQSIPLSYTLGIPGIPTTEDMEHSGDLPPDWQSSTTGAGVAWTADSSQSISGSYSVFAPSTTTTGSSIFTSPSFTLPSPPGIISFSHIYGFTGTKDGGVLEISVDGGNWQDILATGASFTANGYNSTLITSTNPLSGRNAWSGNSGGFITTSIELPASLGGILVQLRWIAGSDSSGKFIGWYLDDILTPRGDSCDTSGPSLELSVSETEISELTPDQGVTLTVATDPPLPVVSPITLTQDSAGSTANLFSDVMGASESNPGIPTGSDSYTTDISAVFDELVEGSESLTLSYLPAPGAVTININDTPYALWALSNLGATGDIGATQDYDFDGSPNIEEFAFQTLGADPNSTPDLSYTLTPSGLSLPAPPTPWPDGLNVTGKTSTDLNIWTEEGVIETTNGFLLPLGSDRAFLRLFYHEAPILDD